MFTPFATFADPKAKWYAYKKHPNIKPKGARKIRKRNTLTECDVFDKQEFEKLIPSYERHFKDVFASSLYFDQDRVYLNAWFQGKRFSYPVYMAYRFFAKLEIEKDGVHHNLLKPFLADIEKQKEDAGLYMRSCAARLSENGVDRYTKKNDMKKKKSEWVLNKEHNLFDVECGIDSIDESSIKVFKEFKNTLFVRYLMCSFTGEQ